MIVKRGLGTKHGLRVCEYRVLRRVFVSKRDAIAGNCGRWPKADGMTRTHRQVLLG